MFIKLFWFLLLLVFSGSIGSSYREDSSEISKIVKGNIIFDLDFQSRVAYIAVKNSISCLPGDRDCEYWVDAAGYDAMRDLTKLKNSYLSFVDNAVKTKLRCLWRVDLLTTLHLKK